MKTLYVIKIGGGLLENEKDLEMITVALSGIRDPWILVHGGGRLATEMAERLGYPVQMIDGRRVTDLHTLRLATMVYGGWVNKSIVARLHGSGIPAIGLTGADAGCMVAKKRKPNPVDFGFVGDLDPDGINAGILLELLEKGIHPVLAPLTVDKEGQLLNTNADTIASVIGQKMSEYFDVRLIMCFEKNGVLLNLDDPDSRLTRITFPQYRQLLEDGLITGGMIPKLDLAFQAIHKGVTKVWIGPGRSLGLISTSPESTGTWLVKPNAS